MAKGPPLLVKPQRWPGHGQRLSRWRWPEPGSGWRTQFGQTRFRRTQFGRAGRWLVRLWRGHRLMTLAVAAAAVPRVLALLAFRPALLSPDSFGYLAAGTSPGPSPWHPMGYPVLLYLLGPFHSLLAVTVVQHLMGIATAVLAYVVLRRWGLPAWVAVLAACPTLFDPRQVALESFILPDSFYALLLMAAVALVLVRGGATLKRCAGAGALLGWAAITRGNGAPEMVALLVVLAFQRAGWRRLVAAAAAFAAPVLGYMGLFASHYGNFALTNSDGMFLWSRTMSFANCAEIHPPASLRPLCPEHSGAASAHTPAWSVPALLDSPAPAGYLWSATAWWRHDATPGFSYANNTRARQFALDAIATQPAAYLRTVASGVMLTFLATDRPDGVRDLYFTPTPEVTALNAAQRHHLAEYGHTSANTHPVDPYAYFLYLYQQPIYFSGLIFLCVVAAGLAGALRQWRRGGGPAAVPWLMAAVGIVFPVAVHEYHYRYAITVVPLACLAAALAFAPRPVAPPSATAEAPPLPAGIVPAQSPPAEGS